MVRANPPSCTLCSQPPPSLEARSASSAWTTRIREPSPGSASATYPSASASEAPFRPAPSKSSCPDCSAAANGGTPLETRTKRWPHSKGSASHTERRTHCIALAGGALPSGRGEKEKPTGFTGATGEITRGDLQGETSAQGTLRFADSHTVRSGFQGVVTQLPTAGAIIHSGESLYQVGDEPAYLFRGSVPAWRAFESGMSNGEDITQLQTALGEMGHMQAEPDGNFGWRTIQAVRSWQKAMGLERTQY